MFLHRGEAGLGWEERNGEHPRLRGATFTSKPDCRHARSGRGRRLKGCSLGSPQLPDLRGSPAPSLRACTCVVYTTRGWLKMYSSTDALRRAAAAHICLHVLVSRFHLFLKGRPGVHVLHWRS